MREKINGRPDHPPGTTSGSKNEPNSLDTANGNPVRAAVESGLQPTDPSSLEGRICVANRNFPASLGDHIDLFQGHDGYAYLHRVDEPRLPALRVGTRSCDAFLRQQAQEKGMFPKTSDLRDINDNLAARAEIAGYGREAWYRVAPIPGGVELDLGNPGYTRIQIRAGQVNVLDAGSETLFYRTPTMQSLPMPAEVGDRDRLNQYLNVALPDLCLIKGWLSYTIAHPAVPATTYPILVLGGDQGSGKTFLCHIIQALTDPSQIGLQTFPRSERDFAISAQQAHVLFYDNMRAIRPAMADKLCIAATGGSLTTRRLYTDSEQVVLPIHCALVLNGIHSFVDQPDLAQRCLPVTLRSLDHGQRRSEESLLKELQADLPYIFRGLLDLIASVFAELPHVTVTMPERIVDFSRWLAAMERVAGIPTDVFQTQYSSALNDGMLDSLLQDPLAAAVMALVDEGSDASWSGTPTELFETLDRSVNRRTSYSRDWPQNAIAMSKRLRSLQAGLRRQGVNVQLSRGRHRRITITRMEGSTHA